MKREQSLKKNIHQKQKVLHHWKGYSWYPWQPLTTFTCRAHTNVSAIYAWISQYDCFFITACQRRYFLSRTFFNTAATWSQPATPCHSHGEIEEPEFNWITGTWEQHCGLKCPSNWAAPGLQWLSDFTCGVWQNITVTFCLAADSLSIVIRHRHSNLYHGNLINLL